MISLEKILSAATKDPSVLSTLREAVTSDLTVKNPHYLAIMRWVAEFRNKYGTLPTDQDAQVWILTLAENRQAPVRSAWNEIRSQDIEEYTLEFLAETGLEELRNIAARNASRMMASMGDQVDPKTLENFTERVKKIRPVGISDVANLSDISKWAKPRGEEDVTYWPTGIPKVDRYIRGFGPELVFVMAESGKGKSSLLVNFGRAAALVGADVFHVSLELDLHATNQRYYSRITEATATEFKHHTDAVKSRAEKWFSLAKGSIHTKYVPAYSISVDDLKTMVELFVERTGNVDMVLLDYMALLKRTRSQESLPRDEQERRISHEVRAIGVEHEAPIISAKQANIQGYGRESLGLRHMGGGIAGVQAADVIFGLTQTDDQESLNQGQLQILKARESAGKNAEIPLYINLDRMVIMDLDDPDARRIRQEERNGQ